MGRLIALSDYYFPMFEEELDRQGLPMEMKYLAVVESALDPRARSRVGATGLWQFMFSTGKMFGLEVNSYVDERSDPLMATEAAAKYLNSLYGSLGDWDLALHAHGLDRVIRRRQAYAMGDKTGKWRKGGDEELKMLCDAEVEEVRQPAAPRRHVMNPDE